MKRSIILIMLVSVLAVLLAACGGDGSTSPAVAEGRQLFNSGGATQVPCASCHTLDGTDLVGPSLQGISERAATRIPGMSAEEYLREAIVAPSEHIVEGYNDVMNKSYGEKLTDEEIDQLVAFLMTQ